MHAELVSCLIDRFQNSPVPGRAWVPSSLYKCGRLGNLGVTSHVFKDTIEYGTNEGSPHATKGFRREALPILMPGLELATLIYVILETRH